MNVRPLHDRVLVSRTKDEEKIGLIYVPNTARKPALEGTVIAVGNGTYNKKGVLRPIDVKPGDKVLFGRYGGEELTWDGEKILALSEDDILCVVEP